MNDPAFAGLQILFCEIFKLITKLLIGKIFVFMFPLVLIKLNIEKAMILYWNDELWNNNFLIT